MAKHQALKSPSLELITHCLTHPDAKVTSHKSVVVSFHISFYHQVANIWTRHDTVLVIYFDVPQGGA